MQSTVAWFRVNAVLPVAFRVTAEADPSNPLLPVRGRIHADRARAAVARVGWENSEARDALRALVDAVAWLESEVERLHNRLWLNSEGLDLESRMVQLGGDGITLLGPCGLSAGQTVHVVLDLDAREGHHLLSLMGEVVAVGAGETTVRFVGAPTEVVDLIVAWCFQQQAKERRRELDRD